MGHTTLNNTLCSETANSYVDIPYADAYWANDYRASLSAQWAALTSAQKTGALVDACQSLEAFRFTLPYNLRDYVNFYDRRTRVVRIVDRDRQPFKFEYKQKLQFPRNLDVYVYDPPSPDLLGQTYIPQELMDAQCEQAVYLMTFDESVLASRMQGILSESVSLGKGAIESSQRFSNSSSNSATMVAPRALEKIRPYFVISRRMQRS